MRLTQLLEFVELDEVNAWLLTMARRGIDVTVLDVKCQVDPEHSIGDYENFLLVCSADVELDSDAMKAFIDEEEDDEEDDEEEDEDDAGPRPRNHREQKVDS